MPTQDRKETMNTDHEGFSRQRKWDGEFKYRLEIQSVCVEFKEEFAAGKWSVNSTPLSWMREPGVDTVIGSDFSCIGKFGRTLF